MTLPDLHRLRAAMPDTGRLVLATHRYPDPDGLGAMLGMQHLLQEALGLRADLVLEGQIRRAENAAMHRLLQIQSLPKGGVDPASYAGVVLVDAQAEFSHTHPPGGLPILAVVDHHEGAEETCATHEVPFRWVDPEYGATSTMVYDLLRAIGVEPDMRVATALFCGIRYDTNHLARGATRRDEEAYLELERKVDLRMVAAIDQPPLSRDYFRQMAGALRCSTLNGPLVLTLMGKVSSPEFVAEFADWFLRLEGLQWSLAGGASDGRYQVSLRTDLAGADAYDVLREILGEDGACGGHGRLAGGQVPLVDRDLEEVRALIRQRALRFFERDPTRDEPLQEPAVDDAVD